MPDWERANAKYQMAESHFYPYPICARTCIKGVRDWCRENARSMDEVEYIFDGGSEHAGDLLELLKRDADPLLRVLRPVPADSAKVWPIQSADYFAWEVRHQTLKDPNPVPADAYPTLARLLRIPERARAGIYDFARLEDLCIAAKVSLR